MHCARSWTAPAEDLAEIEGRLMSMDAAAARALAPPDTRQGGAEGSTATPVGADGPAGAGGLDVRRSLSAG
jgi:hypothetical protein